MLDHHGLIGKGRPVEDLLFSQGSFQRSDLPSGMGLLEVVRAVKPTILIGLSGAKGIFTGDVLREMSKHVERPVILPLSNPSDNSECTAEEVCKHTKGKAIFASGSPFPSVKMSDGKVMHTNQCNNIYSFPGMGLAVSTCGLRRVTDEMFHASAVKIASLMNDKDVSKGILFPPLAQLRDVSAHVAAAIVEEAMKQDLVRDPPPPDEDIVDFMATSMWTPSYDVLVPVH
mmetsp:Transcript_36170/g.144587  ORF Transcript_36170/g.144587 Transcript_36170/m.144587 type:complete len:229 (-) Transcript_36170:1563-2249(-)